MKSDRIVFHCDCNSFFASVEETFHPEFKKVPMAVAGDPENRRGIILAKNELAKKFDVKTAETIFSARTKCPSLLLCPPRKKTYGEFCRRVNEIYECYTERVERFGIDESFLDVTATLHMFGGNAEKLANEIRERVKKETGITISVGVSWNKIFAKLGSDMKKPDAVTVISRENMKETVWPLPVGDLFMVGHSTEKKLRTMYIKTIGDLAKADDEYIVSKLGRVGHQLQIFARGKDDSPVHRIGESEPVKSVGNGLTFKRNLVTIGDIRTGIAALCDNVAGRLRKLNMKCHTLQITIKDSELKSIQRQKATKHPTFLAADLKETAMEIIENSWKIGVPIRMLTVTAGNLRPAEETSDQLSLFSSGKEERKAEALEKTLDKIRGRFGRHSIGSGAVLKNDLGISELEVEDNTK